MPFDPDNPPSKLKNLSDKKKRQWVYVFNSCYKKNKDDKKCHMQAWGAVKKTALSDFLNWLKKNEKDAELAPNEKQVRVPVERLNWVIKNLENEGYYVLGTSYNEGPERVVWYTRSKIALSLTPGMAEGCGCDVEGDCGCEHPHSMLPTPDAKESSERIIKELKLITRDVKAFIYAKAMDRNDRLPLL